MTRHEKNKTTYAITMLSVLLAASLLAGCAGTDGDTTGATIDTSDDAPPADGTTEVAAYTPRSLEDLFGGVTLNEKPTRVVCLMDGCDDTMIALGEKPIAVPSWQDTAYASKYVPHLTEQLEGVETIADSWQPNLEQILALEPDLIVIGSYFEATTHEQLSKIAPTLAIDWRLGWKASLPVYGRIFAKEPLAASLLADYEEKAAQARIALDDKVGDETFLAARIRPKDVVMLYPANAGVGSFLSQDLGLILSEVVHATEWKDLTEEAFYQADPDHLFLEVDNWKGGKERFEAMQQNPLWTSMDAVRNERVYHVTGWPLMGHGPIGNTLRLEQAVEFLTGEETPAAAPVEEPQWPRTIEHALGSTTIPSEPTRVAVTITRIADNVLSVGVQPIAVGTCCAGSESYLKSELGDYVELSWPPNLEALLAAQPDLILADPWTKPEAYEQYSKIAPTVVISGGDWRDYLPQVGAALGREAKADDVMAAYDAKAAAAKERLDEALGNETVMFLRVRASALYLRDVGDTHLSRVLYKDLGLTPPAGIPAENNGAISTEGLASFDPDHIIVEPTKFDTGAQARFEELAQTSVWKELKAVKNDAYFFVDSNLWIEGDGPIGWSRVIDEVLAELAPEEESA